MNFPNRVNLGTKSIADVVQSDYVVHIGEVISVDDNTDSGIVYAKIPNIDDKVTQSKTDKSLAAFPLTAKFIHIYPKVGELVFIIIQNNDRPHSNRFWMGPIISQPQFLNLDKSMTATSGLKTDAKLFSKAPSSIPEANGVYPKKDEIAIQGRDNADLLFRPKQVVIRAGKFDVTQKNIDSVPVFNEKNPAYFKLAYNVAITRVNNKTEYGSIATMVADKLLLLTNSGKHDDFNEYILSKPNVELTEETILEALSKGEPAVYGNSLIELIKLIIQYVENHVHPGAGSVSIYDNTKLSLINYNLDSILAKNIRLV